MIACGGYHTVIQNEKNEIYVCGHNYYGQLGLGDNIVRKKFEKVEKNFGKIKNIACGGYHTVIQNEKNEIYVCGANWNGQLGLGDYENRNIFEKVEYDFGKIKNIVCGECHTIIQNEKNEIYGCGNNGSGQVGLGRQNIRNKFEKIDFNFGEIKKITCGGCYTIIQNEKNEVYVRGYNRFGQWEVGDEVHRDTFEKVECDFGEIKNIACGVDYIIIQNKKNDIYVCGYNGFGQLGDEGKYIFEKVECNFGDIKNIVCGGYYMIIQNEKNEIYACGGNLHGQLGLGHNKNQNVFQKALYYSGKIKNIACGGCHMAIRNEKNEIYVCGWNRYGQLGLGDNVNRNIFKKVNTDDIFEKIYNFELKINTREIIL